MQRERVFALLLHLLPAGRMELITGTHQYEILNERLLLKNAARIFLDAVGGMQAKAAMPKLDWMERHIINPTGPLKGQFFSRRDQPATSLFIELTEMDCWRKITLLGPNQAGKSYSIVSMILEGLFNAQEDHIFALPTISNGMWNTKYKKDFKPVISQSEELSKLFSDYGSGSRGGTPTLLLFKNGVSLQVMGAGGNANARAAATARKVYITELKDFGDSDTSGEGSKYDQMEARTLSMMERRVVLGESTTTTTDNISWLHWLAGTMTMAKFPCPSCEHHVCPEREHLVGWQDARTEEEAGEKARFSCPNCGFLFDDSLRIRLLQESVALHGTQQMIKGKLIGERPPTSHLSFRFTASTNAFARAGVIGRREWELKHQKSESRRRQLNKTISQQLFATAVDPKDLQINPLDEDELFRRCCEPDVWVVPARADRLFAGLDVKKTHIHFTLTAFGPGFMQTIAWSEERLLQDISEKKAIQKKVLELQSRFRNGFRWQRGGYKSVDLSLIDANWNTDAVREVTDKDETWFPFFGRSDTEFGEFEKKYNAPKEVKGDVIAIGDRFDVRWQDGRRVVFADSSHQKSRLHEALRLPINEEGALRFSFSPEDDLRLLISHIRAEHEVIDAEGGIERVKFVRQGSQANHLLDSTSYSIIAGKVYQLLWPVGREEQEQELLQQQDIIVEGKGFLFG